MAEVQNSTNAGESTARFIEFVMMQAQNASLFMGLMPNPHNNQPEVNLDLARMFIDQLEMIRDKTRGNLSGEETNVLRNALTNLQMAFVEVSGKGGGSRTPAAEPAPTAAASEDKPSQSDPVPAVAPTGPEGDGRKRFSKSYGS